MGSEGDQAGFAVLAGAAQGLAEPPLTSALAAEIAAARAYRRQHGEPGRGDRLAPPPGGRGDPNSTAIRMEWSRIPSPGSAANSGPGRAGKRRRSARPILARMIAAAEGEGTRAVRDRALLALGLAAAQRRAELFALQHADLEVVREGVKLTISAPRSPGTTTAPPIVAPRSTV